MNRVPIMADPVRSSFSLRDWTFRRRRFTADKITAGQVANSRFTDKITRRQVISSPSYLVDRIPSRPVIPSTATSKVILCGDTIWVRNNLEKLEPKFTYLLYFSIEFEDHIFSSTKFRPLDKLTGCSECFQPETEFIWLSISGKGRHSKGSIRATSSLLQHRLRLRLSSNFGCDVIQPGVYSLDVRIYTHFDTVVFCFTFSKYHGGYTIPATGCDGVKYARAAQGIFAIAATRPPPYALRFSPFSYR